MLYSTTQQLTEGGYRFGGERLVEP